MYENAIAPGSKVSLTPLEAWRRLVALVYPDFTEDELVCLSEATLSSLMPTYGMLSTAEMGQVIAVWQQKQPREDLIHGAPDIAELPPPLQPSRSATPLLSPAMQSMAFSPCTSWAQADDLQEVCIQKGRDAPLGFVFTPNTLCIENFVESSPAAQYASRFVGHFLTHVDGEAVNNERDVRFKTEDKTYLILRFKREAPFAVVDQTLHEMYEAPLLPTPFRNDSPDSLRQPFSKPRTPRKRRPVTDGKVDHPKPFEVPLPQRKCSLGRRKRLSTCNTGTSNPNNISNEKTEHHSRGKICVTKEHDGSGYGGGGWFAGRDPYEEPAERPGKRGYPLRKSGASGNPNVPLEPQIEEKKGKGTVTTCLKVTCSDPNSIENTEPFPTGRYRPAGLKEQDAAVGDPNEMGGPCDPYAREIQTDGYLEGNTWMATLSGRVPFKQDQAASCNPNDTSYEASPLLMSPRKAPVRAPYAGDHGPPGLWPDGGPKDKSRGLRKLNVPDQGVMHAPDHGKLRCASPARMTNWSLCDAAANERASQGMRFISSGKQANGDLESKWSQTARNDARKVCNTHH
eukprot:TRINITY_DN10289_c0_g1_i2.p1 TRINITY_DN10289_c0_g1~~TRINITY_DN10289_c0_g1_i2.p1  ORF type:complete len:569 (+),score=76.45 TRINITY_DN10289_c0_g1_i2:62-1768(+)